MLDDIVETPRPETNEMIAEGGTPLRLSATRVYNLRRKLVDNSMNEGGRLTEDRPSRLHVPP